MRNYVKPVVIENNEMMEGIYVSSGYQTENNGSASLTWTNQNSGSHSDISLMVTTGELPGEYFRVTITYVGGGDITWGGVPSEGTASGNSVTIVREGHYNPRENFQYSINNIVFSEMAEGYTGDGEHFGARYPTGEKIGESALGDFSIDYQILA